MCWWVPSVKCLGVIGIVLMGVQWEDCGCWFCVGVFLRGGLSPRDWRSAVISWGLHHLGGSTKSRWMGMLPK